MSILDVVKYISSHFLTVTTTSPVALPLTRRTLLVPVGHPTYAIDVTAALWARTRLIE